MKRGAALAAAGLLVAACGGPPILANPPLTLPTPMASAAPPSRQPDPIPVAFPLDDGPHDRLTEWWYYTGHLRTREGRRFGFEAVVFRAERSSVPVAWASHLALTDEAGRRFLYAQRSEIGPQVDRSPRTAAGVPAGGFDLQVSGLNPALVAAGAAPLAAVPWRLSGAAGFDTIQAGLTTDEAEAAGGSFGLSLHLLPGRSPVLHDEDGFVDFGPAGTSYYYSRPRLSVLGELTVDGDVAEVEGTAWFDHQWGDFISVGGGWDWFAINLGDDGATDLTVSVVRDPDGNPVLVYGTLDRTIDGGAARETRRLGSNELEVETLGAWTSPDTGRTWPSGWRVTMSGGLVIELRPTVLDQELDTRATTGVVYWEGSQIVSATSDGERIPGEAYVEITRYAD